MKKTVILLSLLVLLPLKFSEATELARINGTVIELSDFNNKYDNNFKFFSMNPPRKSEVLNDIIKRELGVQEFYNLKLDKDPVFKEKIDTFLFNLLIERKLGVQFQQIKISDESIKKNYQRYPHIRTSHIFVAIPPKADQMAERKAYLKIKQIEELLSKGGSDFKTIAQKYSEDPSAAMGGDLDFQDRTSLDPVYYDAALALTTPGKITGIIRTRSGFHIIKLTAIKPWESVDQNMIKQHAHEDERKKLFNEYIQKLRDKATVIVNPGLISE